MIWIAWFVRWKTFGHAASWRGCRSLRNNEALSRSAPIWWVCSIGIIHVGKWAAPSLHWQLGQLDVFWSVSFYAALVLLTLASALGHGSLIGLGVTVLLWWMLDKLFVRVEENLLVETFGDEAKTYLSRTRRWI
jgi:hypothetical protein